MSFVFLVILHEVCSSLNPPPFEDIKEQPLGHSAQIYSWIAVTKPHGLDYALPGLHEIQTSQGSLVLPWLSSAGKLNAILSVKKKSFQLQH